MWTGLQFRFYVIINFNLHFTFECVQFLDGLQLMWETIPLLYSLDVVIDSRFGELMHESGGSVDGGTATEAIVDGIPLMRNLTWKAEKNVTLDTFFVNYTIFFAKKYGKFSNTVNLGWFVVV